MRTKYDLFSAIVRNSNKSLVEIANIANISYPSAIKMKKSLEKEGLISALSMAANNKAKLCLEIIEWCTYYDLNYNFFFSEEFAKFISIALSKGEITSKDEKLFNKNTFFKYVKKLREKHLILIVSKKPFRAIIYQNNIFKKILEFYDYKIKIKEVSPDNSIYNRIEKLVKKKHPKKEIEFLHSSLFMEGTTLTLSDTMNLFIKKIYPQKPIIDIKNMENYKEATDFVLANYGKKLDKQTILRLQATAMKDATINVGMRHVDVHIRGNPKFKICKTSNIEKELDGFIVLFNKKTAEKQTTKQMIENSSFIHDQFQYVHPFEDGNSRTTRLIWQYFLLNKGFPLIDIYAVQREKYLSLTKLYDKRDDKKLADFFTFIILDNLNSQ